MASKKLEVIRNYCMECNGEGEISACCQDYISPDRRCGCCGKFCKSDSCYDCDGSGYNEYRVGDEVQVFVCVWSPEELQDQLYRPKAVGDTKTYEGVIQEIIDEHHVWVKIKYRRGGLVKTGLDELEIR